MLKNKNYPNFAMLFPQRPQAFARVLGDKEHPEIFGGVRFYQTAYGVVVIAEIKGLPTREGKCDSPIFGFHIHGGGRCEGNERDTFADAGAHYDQDNCPHPYHAGDMSPLFSADGLAFAAFLTDRFQVKEIVGKTVIVHAMSDDLKTQPSGNSGAKIACGEIVG